MRLEKALWSDYCIRKKQHKHKMWDKIFKDYITKPFGVLSLSNINKTDTKAIRHKNTIRDLQKTKQQFVVYSSGVQLNWEEFCFPNTSMAFVWDSVWAVDSIWRVTQGDCHLEKTAAFCKVWIVPWVFPQ